jgi:hypothetical protein
MSERSWQDVALRLAPEPPTYAVDTVDTTKFLQAVHDTAWQRLYRIDPVRFSSEVDAQWASMPDQERDNLALFLARCAGRMNGPVPREPIRWVCSESHLSRVKSGLLPPGQLTILLGPVLRDPSFPADLRQTLQEKAAAEVRP